MVLRNLDELLNVVVPLLGQLDDLVNSLVASVLVLLRCKSNTDRLGLGHLVGLLHGQSSNTSLESESLEETTALKFGVLVELAAGHRRRLLASRGDDGTGNTASARRHRRRGGNTR